MKKKIKEPIKEPKFENSSWNFEVDIAYPTDGKMYYWNEEILNWELVTE